MISLRKKIVTALLFLLAFFYSTSKTEAQITTFSEQDFRVEVGEEQYVMGPVDIGLDSPFFTVPITSGLRAFSANGDTYSFSGSNLNHLSREGIVLSKGARGNFDECGAWLHSVHKITETHWVGWYHAERSCNYSINVTYKSVAFAESFDAGRTWTKPDYPNNQVITSATPFNGTQGGAGDHKVIRVGDYFYMFFLEDSGTRIARSRVSDLGKPGTWYRYYNGQFTEPGLNGQATRIDQLYRTYTTYNTYLERFLNISTQGLRGFMLRYSNVGDITTWNEFPATIFPPVSSFDDARVDFWSLTGREDKLSVYAYGSVIGISGDSDTTGQSFYIYYMKIFPGEDFSKKYLLRRMITLRKRDSPYGSVAVVTRYLKGTTERISTELAKPSEGYIKDRNVGYVLTHSRGGFVPVYECQRSSGDYFLTKTQPTNWVYCESPENKFIRRIGWVSSTVGNDATTPLLDLGYIFSTPFTSSINQPTVSCTTPGASSQMAISWNATEGVSRYSVMVDTTEVRGNVTATSYTHPGLAPGSSHTARVRACNASGCGTYSNPSISVLCPAAGVVPLQGDLDGDGVVNSFDWGFMRTRWGTNDVTADINRDGTVNSLDFSYLSKNWMVVGT